MRPHRQVRVNDLTKPSQGGLEPLPVEGRTALSIAEDNHQ
jgi:hypothetical protein